MSSVKDFMRRLSLRKSKKKFKSEPKLNGSAKPQTFAGLQDEQIEQMTSPSSNNASDRLPPQLYIPPPPPPVIPLEQHTPTNGQPRSAQVDGEWIHETITLVKRDRCGLGFTVAGGKLFDDLNDVFDNTDQHFYVTSIVDGGLAATDGRLRVGDIIVSVNGTPLKGMNHRQAIDTLKDAGSRVRLAIKRMPPGTMEKIVEIYLIKQDKGLGFTVAGGIDDPIMPNDNGVFVTMIVPDGVADVDGRLAVGDRLIAVNEVNMCDVPHAMAVSTLKSTQGLVRLVVGKAPKQPEPETNNNVSRRSRRTRPASQQARRLSSNDDQSVNHYAELSDLRPPTSVPADGRVTQMSTSSRRGGPSAAATATTAAGAAATAAAVTAVEPPTQQNLRTPMPQLVPRVMTDKDVASFVKEPREVVLKKKQLTDGLGFNIVGGKEGHGVFISSLIPGGLAESGGELRRGDQLLAVNDTDLKDASHDEAVTALKSVGKVARLTVRYRPEEFGHFERMVRELCSMPTAGRQKQPNSKPLPLRTVFVRALFDYDPTKDRLVEPQTGSVLRLSFGDILQVVLPASPDNGAMTSSVSGADWWQARRVVPWSVTELSSGLIPSKQRIESIEAEKLKNLAEVMTTVSELKERPSIWVDESYVSVTTNYDARVQRSVKKRQSFKFSNKLPLIKTKEGTATDEIYYTGTRLCYQPVVQLQVRYTRPVVILGPLKDNFYDQLMAEFPDQYRGCVPHTSRPKRIDEFNGTDYHFVTQEQMEQEIQQADRSPYIEIGVYNEHLYGIAISSVFHIAKQGKHCLLDVSADAIVRLQAADIHPIALLIKPVKPQTLCKEAWGKTDEESKKAYAMSTKLLHEYGQYFTAVVNAETPNQTYTRVKQFIEEQSIPVIWVASHEDLMT